MNKFTVSLILCFALFVGQAAIIHAEKVIIYGNAQSYAGDELNLIAYKNYITHNDTVLSQTVVDSAGYFKFETDIDKTREVMLFLGVYRCFLYAVPGKEYEIILPVKKLKSKAERLNPFFEPIETHLALKNYNEEELNFLIRSFNQSYLPYYNKHVIDVMVRNDFSDLDSAIASMSRPFENVENEYFKVYEKYSYARLRYLALQRRSRNISDHFFLNQRVHYFNSAYMLLFNKVYDDYFTYFGRTEEGKKIYSDISTNKSIKALKSTLAQDDVLSNDTLKELVILKCLHDEFYKDKFSRSAILTLLDSVKLTTHIERHREIAANILYKVTRLMPGYAPPDFLLYDRDSTLISMKDFKGHYVYLNFCSCQSYTCLNEFQILDELNKRIGKHIKIVTITVDDTHRSLTRFLELYPYEWTFLHYANTPDVLEDYDIRGFPTYFLIGPDGKIILSPAPTPSEKFSDTLFKIMRERGDI